MSATTPAASSGALSPANASTQDLAQNADRFDRLVLEYLRARGHKNAEIALAEVIESASSDEAGRTVSSEDLIKGLAVFAQKPSRPGENVLKDSSYVLQELSTMGNPSSIQNLIASLGTSGAEEILSMDPTDKHEGFRELETWVEGSLDMYKPEFRPILFPIFCHFYLDLIQKGFKEAALRFHAAFSSSLAAMHSVTLHHLSTLLLPSHVQNDELAQRFHTEKYVIRMSRSGFSLLVGWLTEGVGGEAPGAGEGFSGEKGKRGRAAVMRVVNNHLQFDVTNASTTVMLPNAWEECTGHLAPLIPTTATQVNASAIPNPHTFNASKGELKLGATPLPEDLRAETERVLREQAMLDRDPGAQYDAYMRPQTAAGIVSPTEADLLPHPPSFKTVDVQREVEKVRDARKRIRFDPSTLNSTESSSTQGPARARALPSICAYTFHDVGEGAPCCAFSPDVGLMAAGFSESYIRLWSLKGDKLKGLRSNTSADSVKDLIGQPAYGMSNVEAVPDGRYLASASEDLAINLWDLGSGRRIKKMIGHTASIYSLAFSAESSLLVSGGADWTVRCWDVKGAGTQGKRQTGTDEASLVVPSEESNETADLLATFPTKRTPITNVHFTPRNLCLVGGYYLPPDLR
ncbi:hypothetical protein ID866_7098 [Astraeus odoratus]|nr:hypothetical protein ID866_7098 [Astraeus odoratus]